MTPFMLAVSGRAYPAAITVLEAAQKMAKGRSSRRAQWHHGGHKTGTRFPIFSLLDMFCTGLHCSLYKTTKSWPMVIDVLFQELDKGLFPLVI